MKTQRESARDRGQVTTEVLMILGLLTVMIIIVTKLVVPAVAWSVVQVIKHVQVFVSTV